MGCSTLVLSIIFRSKHRKMSHLPRNYSANIFDKTFNIFNPYPEHRRIIHNFLSALPLIVVLASLVFVPFALKAFESGLLLSLVLLIICLNLMLIEVASETYQNAKIFIKAFNSKADLSWRLESFPNTEKSHAKTKQLLPYLINPLFNIRCDVRLYLAFILTVFRPTCWSDT